MRRRFNWKLFVLLLILGGTLGVGIHFLHAHQLEQMARHLRAQATAALQAGEYDTAGPFLTRYLAILPQDVDALSEYGLVLQMQNKHERALQAYKQVLVLDPARRDVRRPLVDLAVRAGHWTTAAAHARVLLEQVPDDGTPEALAERGDLEHILGRCHEGKRRYAEAAAAYARAIRYDPQLIDAYLRRAALLRDRLKQPAQADVVMTTLVTRNPESFRAQFARGRYRQKWQLQGANADLQRARSLARQTELQGLEEFLAATELALLDGDLNEARTFLARAAEQFSNERRLYQQLARVELQAGRAEEAIAALRSGLVALPGDRDLRVRLAEALLTAGKTPEAEKEMEALRKVRNFPAVLLHYLDAHLLVQQKLWAEASQLLEGIRDQLASAPDLLAEADHLLSRCYDQLGERDQYFATLQRSIADAARGGLRTGAARFRLGSALLAAGRIDEALGELTQAAGAADAPPQVWVRLAEATLGRAARTPPDQRQPLWDQVGQYLTTAESLLPEGVEVALLRAQMHAVQGDLDGAEAVLRKARDSQPQRIEFWTALVALLVRRQAEPEKVLSVLDHAQRKLGDTADVRLLRARWWATRPLGEARPALAALAKNLDKFAAEEQPRLTAGLAEAYARIGELRASEQWWLQYVELQPRDLRARQVLFELALQIGNDEAAQKAVADLRAAEGEEGIYWRACAAVHHLQLARREGAGDAIAEARRLLDEVRARRPKWARVAVLEGELAELEGKPEEAVAKYQLAIDQGERSLRLIQRTVQLLTSTRQYRAADQLIARLGDGGSAVEVLSWLNIDASLRANDLGRAEILARTGAQANPKDYRQQLWLGQVLAAAGKLSEAERALLRAVELASEVPETWITLVQLQVRRDPKKAEATVEKALEHLPPEHAPLTLGPCYEMLGQREKAAEQYQAALAARPTHPDVLRTVALYWARAGEPAKAETLLRKLLEPAVKAPDALAAWARRTLAIGMAGGDYGRFKEGLRLLDENIRHTGGSPNDQRARAILLDRPGQRLEAIQILEELSKSGPPAASDQFLLARLHEAVGDWPRADQYLTAVTASTSDPAILAYHARGLLRNGDAGRAGPLVEKLQKAEPKALSTLELQARLLHAGGQSEKVPELFQEVLQEAKSSSVVGLVAVLFEELGLVEAAENTYRAFADRTKLPESDLSLARFLSRQGKAQEALEVCEQVAPQLPPEVVAGVLSGIVRTAKADKGLTARAERWIRSALDAAGAAKPPRSVGLLSALANLLDYQGRYTEAIQTYRRILTLTPNDSTAANNLAWLVGVSDRKGATEALRLITHTIDNLVGPNPVLLDTRATVLLTLGRTAEAIQDLQNAVAEAPSAPRYFHLAQAFRLAKRRQEAKENLDVARAMGLEPTHLHPLELPAYKTLCAELGIK